MPQRFQHVDLSNVTRHTSHVTRHMSHVTRHTSHATSHTPHITRHTSHVTRHTSHVTRHTSHVTRHTSHITRHTCPPSPPGRTHPACRCPCLCPAAAAASLPRQYLATRPCRPASQRSTIITITITTRRRRNHACPSPLRSPPCQCTCPCACRSTRSSNCCRCRSSRSPGKGGWRRGKQSAQLRTQSYPNRHINLFPHANSPHLGRLSLYNPRPRISDGKRRAYCSWFYRRGAGGGGGGGGGGGSFDGRARAYASERARKQEYALRVAQQGVRGVGSCELVRPAAADALEKHDEIAWGDGVKSIQGAGVQGVRYLAQWRA
jgi:hypothetical protein